MKNLFVCIGFFLANLTFLYAQSNAVFSKFPTLTDLKQDGKTEAKKITAKELKQLIPNYGESEEGEEITAAWKYITPQGNYMFKVTIFSQTENFPAINNNTLYVFTKDYKLITQLEIQNISESATHQEEYTDYSNITLVNNRIQVEMTKGSNLYYENTNEGDKLVYVLDENKKEFTLIKKTHFKEKSVD